MLPSNTQAPSGRDRRSSPRLPCSPNTVVRVADALDQTDVVAGSWNISTGGMCFLAEPHFAPGARLAVELQDRTTDTFLDVPAEVIYSLLLPSQREMWMTGCSFAGPQVADELLRRYSGPERPTLGKPA